MSDINTIKKTVSIVGAGAAGLIAAYFSALNNNDVSIYEKNEKIGKKLYISGKGRCNLTNNCSVTEFLSNIVTNSKFLYSALYGFTPDDTIKLFEENGLKLKTERGNRVFPVSDKSSDVIKALGNLCKNLGVKIYLNSNVDNIIVVDGKIKGLTVNEEFHPSDSVIIATGGISYPATGSTGDGYKFAKSVGHKLISPVQSLCGFDLNGDFYKDLQGLSLKNVKLTALFDEKTVFSDFGEMLFTHFGISGPIVLSCSCLINRFNLRKVKLSLDLKPAISDNVLDERLIREIKENNVKNFITVMRNLVPKAMAGEILKRANVSGDKICAEITAKERERIVDILKRFSMSPKSLRPFSEAIVTAGGVDVKGINPKTMESKIVKGLFFAGEVLDVDCFTGGFNIQTAFSTGCLAGKNA